MFIGLGLQSIALRLRCPMGKPFTPVLQLISTIHSFDLFGYHAAARFSGWLILERIFNPAVNSVSIQSKLGMQQSRTGMLDELIRNPEAEDPATAELAGF